MAKTNDKKIQVRSVIGAILQHNDKEIYPNKNLMMDEEEARPLIAKGFLEEVKL